MRNHGETNGAAIWCASCNRWCAIASGNTPGAGERLFAVEHAHGETVVARMMARRARLVSPRADERLAVDVLALRRYVAAVAWENEQAMKDWVNS